MVTIDLGVVRYVGADLLPELIQANRCRYANSGREFQVLDLLSSPLPVADLVLCRDCLVHLSFADIARAIANLRTAPVVYLLNGLLADKSLGLWRVDALVGSPRAST